LAGDLDGVVLTFSKKGDVLPMHTHYESDVHITVVARGRVKIYGPHIATTEHAAGAVIDNAAPITHEIVALEDDSRIVNIVKRIKSA
jgi:quercetin dioxygenase-like cupin family protein